MKNLKIFAERNTGSRYLTKLLESNLDIKFLRSTAPIFWRFWNYDKQIPMNFYFDLTSWKNLGWKHSFIDIENIAKYSNLENLIVITLTKNPYSFLLSLYKRPYAYIGSKPKTFNKFLTSEWTLQSRDNLSKKKLETPINLWNSKNKSYIKCNKIFSSITINVKYENLIANPEKIVESISNKYSVKKESKFVNIFKSTKNSKKTYQDYVSYYLKRKWRKKLNKESVEIINSKIDKETMEYFGYSVIQL